MIRIFALSGLLTVSGATGAWAQTSPAPSAPPSTDQGSAGQGGTATNETYKMKDGGMYQPPAKRPASPAMDMSIYGRT